MTEFMSNLSEFHLALLESLAILEGDSDDPIRGKDIRDMLTGENSIDLSEEVVDATPQYVSLEDGLSHIFDIDAPADSHFYNKLDELADMGNDGLINKYPRCPDGRSNSYELTEEGRRVIEIRSLRSHVARQSFTNLAGD